MIYQRPLQAALLSMLSRSTPVINVLIGPLHDAGNTTTLAHYLKLLEAAFMASGLELFSQGVHRKRGSSPKLIL
jgi:uncharacterized protein